jgi:hypothetical protein
MLKTIHISLHQLIDNQNVNNVNNATNDYLM